MPPRSKIAQLPDAERAALDRELIDRRFAGYEDLVAWCRDRGLDIGKTALNDYGRALQRRLESIQASTHAAAAILEAAPDEADARSGAIVSLVQSEIFDVLLQLQEAEGEDDKAARLKLLNGAAKNIATLTRASVTLKKHQMVVAEKVKAAATAAERIARKGGLSQQAAAEIRAAILGIAQ